MSVLGLARLARDSRWSQAHPQGIDDGESGCQVLTQVNVGMRSPMEIGLHVGPMQPTTDGGHACEAPHVIIAEAAEATSGCVPKSGQGNCIEAEAKCPEGERARPHEEPTSSGAHGTTRQSISKGPTATRPPYPTRSIQRGTQLDLRSIAAARPRLANLSCSPSLEGSGR